MRFPNTEKKTKQEESGKYLWILAATKSYGIQLKTAVFAEFCRLFRKVQLFSLVGLKQKIKYSQIFKYSRRKIESKNKTGHHTKTAEDLNWPRETETLQ